jgi:SPP1 gp7 family putative phage head morphogenesis protein
MNGIAYWAARAQRAAAAAYVTQEARTAAFLRAYNDAYDDLLKETTALYAKYAAEGELSLTELYRYDRYSKYLDQVKGICIRLGEREGRFATLSFEKLYVGGINDISDLFSLEFSKVPQKTLKAILDFPWSGANYSTRIWQNMDKLINDLNQTMIRGVVKGQPVSQMVAALKDSMGSAAYDARRLIRTESMHFINQGHLDGYKRLGVTQVDILVAQDERTCPICRNLEGGPYDINEAQLILPTHPQCRCTFVPRLNNI